MYIYRLVLLLLMGIYYFSPVIVNWLFAEHSKWYEPYAYFLGMIFIASILQFSNKNNNDL